MLKITEPEARDQLKARIEVPRGMCWLFCEELHDVLITVLVNTHIIGSCRTLVKIEKD